MYTLFDSIAAPGARSCHAGRPHPREADPEEFPSPDQSGSVDGAFFAVAAVGFGARTPSRRPSPKKPQCTLLRRCPSSEVRVATGLAGGRWSHWQNRAAFTALRDPPPILTLEHCSCNLLMSSHLSPLGKLCRSFFAEDHMGCPGAARTTWTIEVWSCSTCPCFKRPSAMPAMMITNRIFVRGIISTCEFALTFFP